MISIWPMNVETPAQRVISVVHKVPVELAKYITSKTRYIVVCADVFIRNWIVAQYGPKCYVSGNVIIVEY